MTDAYNTDAFTKVTEMECEMMIRRPSPGGTPPCPVCGTNEDVSACFGYGEPRTQIWHCSHCMVVWSPKDDRYTRAVILKGICGNKLGEIGICDDLSEVVTDIASPELVSLVGGVIPIHSYSEPVILEDEVSGHRYVMFQFLKQFFIAPYEALTVVSASEVEED